MERLRPVVFSGLRRCPEKLKNKVERAEGRDIGLDKRFAYFRYRAGVSRSTILEENRQAVEAFDGAGTMPPAQLL
jgi:hypothetical protein